MQKKKEENTAFNHITTHMRSNHNAGGIQTKTLVDAR